MRSARASVVAVISLTVLQLSSGQSDEVPNVQTELLKPKGLRVSIPVFDITKKIITELDRNDANLESLKEAIAAFEKELTELEKKDDELKKKEKKTAWNVETISEPGGFVKIRINTKPPRPREENLTEEEKEAKMKKFIYENEKLLKQSGMLRKYDDSRQFLQQHSNLVCEETCHLVHQLRNGRANQTSGGTDQDGCLPTVTSVRMGKACGGQVIFEDNFDTFNEDVWQIEQYIRKEHSDYPFNSYQRSTVSIVNGSLQISPVLQQNLQGYSADSIYSGTLDLFSGCTSSAESCFMRASGADILPPIASGRVTSKGFAFKYGTMELRARLPQGDWLYPEILLEPLLNKYGSWNQASGILKWACARGNAVLHAGSTDYGNKILYGGAIIDTRCRDALMSSKVASGGNAWGDEFHVYSMRWTPELITWSVDGAEWGRVAAGEARLRARLPLACADTRDAPRAPPGDTKMAPFDEHFYMTLGVAVGGIAEFPDGVVTMNGHPKPWRNQERKAVLRFWQDLGSWLSTWNPRNPSKLVVDYIRIRAL